MGLEWHCRSDSMSVQDTVIPFGRGALNGHRWQLCESVKNYFFTFWYQVLNYHQTKPNLVIQTTGTFQHLRNLTACPSTKNSLLRWRWSISRLNQPHNCQLWCILGWKHVWPSSGHAGRGKQVVQKFPRLLPSNFLAATEGTQPTSTPHTHTHTHTFTYL